MLENLMINSGSPGTPVTPSVPGTPFEGGYYAGKIQYDGKTYALIVSPKAQGEPAGTIRFKASNTNTPNTGSLNDGWSNTLALVEAGADIHSAAAYCRSLIIDGYNDWYLPSVNELEICYRNLKPTTASNTVGAAGYPNGANGFNPSSIPVGAAYTTTNPAITSSTIFVTGGAQAFIQNYYWTSTQKDAGETWIQNLNSGNQIGTGKTTTRYLRAIRRVLI
jgi:hypothetical protein